MLGRILNVSIAELRHWKAGKAAAPLPAFNHAMKLVNDAYRAAGRHDSTYSGTLRVRR